MTRPYSGALADPTRFEEMLELRRQGVSFPALAKRYGKDHTTIMYHCRKHGVKPLRGSQSNVTNINLMVTPVRTDLVTELYELYKEGDSISRLAAKNNKTYEWIYEEFRRRGYALRESPYELIVVENINPGKRSYLDYIKAAGEALDSDQSANRGNLQLAT